MDWGLVKYTPLVALFVGLAFASDAASDLRPTASFSEFSVKVSIPAENGAKHSFEVEFASHPGESRYCAQPGVEACLSWGHPDDSTRLVVEKTKEGRHKISLTSAHPAKVCFDIKGKHLYGGPVKQVYPQEKTELKRLPYITADQQSFKTVQPVTERYWYSSTGLNVKVDPEAPLFLDQTEKSLCLVVENTFPYTSDLPIQISYETCVDSRNLREGVNCFFKSWEKPVPLEQVVGSPIWSTWVEFKRGITQDKVLEFYKTIRSHDFRLSVIEVDDMWETCYGSQTFNKNKFPDPKAMVDTIHDSGYLVTLWVHPFVGPGCDDISPYEPYLVKYPNGTIGLTDWWNGKGAHLVNFTDPNASGWYEKRLLNLQKEYGFDSFKFDSGEAGYIPGITLDAKFSWLKEPNKFTAKYVQTASKFGHVPNREGTLAEVRVGFETQSYPVMLRLLDTNSVWDATHWGLRSVIKSILQLSLHGYGALLPDMVGGNLYDDNVPDDELFIRWLQVNTFLPVIQFSYVPWNYGPETLNLTKKFVNMHYEFKDRILKEFHDPSHPVINPIWWISPEDKVAQTIDDQFLLGESLLVAPVVRQGAVSRDIYLPAGDWKDANTGKVYTGPQRLKNYPAPLEVLPYFERVTN